MRRIFVDNIFITVILLLFVIGNINSTIFLFLSLALLIAKMLYSDEESTYLICFLIPFIQVFDRIGISFIVNLLFTVPLFLGLARKRIVPDGKSLAICTFLFLWELIHILMFSNYSSLTSTIASFITLYYCLCVFTNCQTIRISTLKLTDFFCCGVIFSAIAYLLCHQSYAHGLINNVLKNQRFAGFAGEPNYYSLYICLGLSLIFTLNNHAKRHYAYIGSMIAIGLLTASKMCLFLTAFILVVGLLYNAMELKNNKRKSFFYKTVACLIIAASFFSSQIMRLLDNIIKRMNITDGQFYLSADSTGRVDILKSYLALCDENPFILLFGYGINYHINLGQEFGAHNTYLDLVLAWGIPFSIVAILLWCSVICIAKNINPHGDKKESIRFFPIIVLAINLTDLSCFSAGMFWLIISIGLVPIIHGLSVTPIFTNERN